MAETKREAKVLSREIVEGGVKFKVAGVGELHLELSRVSAENKEYATLHGFIQRITDAAALSRDGATGKSASPQEKFDAMKVLVEHYNSGATGWNLSGGERGPSEEVKLLVEALSEVYPTKGKDELTAWVRKRSKAEVIALSEQENLKTIITRLRGERAKGVDAAALLGELGVGL